MFAAGYTIGSVKVNPGLILAPMSGVTTRAFRRLLKECNGNAIGLTVTEFISVEAMTRNVPRSLDMMRTFETERPFAIQIFGYDIERMCSAAQMVQDSGADIVDINCGCPAPKVVRKGGGCELMRQPDHLRQILVAVRKAVSIPMTVKIRAGWDQSCINAVEIARMAQGEGADAIAVHGRTRAQMYRGESDWNLIAEVRAALSIPVLGSGDVIDVTSALQRATHSEAHGLMVGRGAISNPYVFRDIVGGQPTSNWQQPEVVVKALRRYIELLKEDFPEKVIPGRVKQLASQFSKSIPFRKQLLLALTLSQQEEILMAFELRKDESSFGPASVVYDDCKSAEAA